MFTVSVIDGATNNTLTIPVPSSASSIVVNEVTNKIFVLNEQNSSVTVLDGTTNQTTVVAVGGIALGIALDSMRNKVYVSCSTEQRPRWTLSTVRPSLLQPPMWIIRPSSQARSR